MRLYTKVIILLLGMTLACEPVIAQKFTKKEQARREARAKNYFYGNTFSLQAGFVNSWLRRNTIVSTTEAGFSDVYQNNRQSFAIGATWNRAVNKWWGWEAGLFYAGFGGEKCVYYNSGLQGTTSQFRSDRSTVMKYGAIELQGLARFFYPLSYFSRVSFDLGVHLDKVVAGGDGVANWDFGPALGVSYEWKYLVGRVIYMPGINTGLVSDAKTAQNSIWFNVGYRFWKK